MSLGGQGVAVNITGGLPTGGTNGQSLKKASGSDFDATWQDDTVTVLADGKIIIGNGSNVGTAVTPSGDATITNAGVIAIGASKVTEAMQVLADNTTNDVSTTKHGYAPKAPNDATKFLRGDGTWQTVGGGSGQTVEMTFQPGGTPAGSVYDNFSTLYTAYQALPIGTPVTIYFDGSYATPTIPNSTFAFDEFVYFVGLTGSIMGGPAATGVAVNGAGTSSLITAKALYIKNLQLDDNNLIFRETASALGPQCYLENVYLLGTAGTRSAVETQATTSNVYLVGSIVDTNGLNMVSGGTKTISMAANSVVNAGGIWNTDISGSGTLYVYTRDFSNNTFATSQANCAATASVASMLPAAPGTASDPGMPGQIGYDATHIYVCIAKDTWVRATAATW